jgi:hypothetical protein
MSSDSDHIRIWFRQPASIETRDKDGIIDTHMTTKKENEPSRVPAPMSIPFIRQTATIQEAASPSVATSAVAVPAALALVAAPPRRAGGPSPTST